MLRLSSHGHVAEIKKVPPLPDSDGLRDPEHGIGDPQTINYASVSASDGVRCQVMGFALFHIIRENALHQIIIYKTLKKSCYLTVKPS